MDLDVERHERITAPALLVWEEMDSLDRILAKSPQALSYDVAAGGERATFTANLAWGPLKWGMAGEVLLHDMVPLEQLHYSLAAPSIGLRYDVVMRLTPLSSGETRLDYHGHFDMRHRLAHRMRGLFSDLVEEHAHGLLSRVKVKAEQRRLAQERLLK